MTKVTIGDQSYVRTATNGWVDEQSQIPANKGLQSLLELIENGQLAPEGFPPAPDMPTLTQASVDIKNLQAANEDKKEAEEKLIDAPEALKNDDDEYDVVTIAGTTYIYDAERGWIDKKTKKQVPPELLSLIEKVSNKKNSPGIAVEKSYEIEPVTIGGTKYIYDTKKRYWVLEKGKEKAPDDVQKLLSQFVSQSALDKLDEESLPTKLFQAKKPELETTAAKKEKAAKILPTNTLIIEMIEKLASINDTITEDLTRTYDSHRKKVAQTREDRIENTNSDATKVIDGNKKKSDSGLKTALMLGTAGLIATHLEEITEVISDIAGWLKKANEFFNDLSEIASGDFSSVATVREMTPQEKTQQDQLLTPKGISGRIGEIYDDVTSGDVFTIRNTDAKPVEKKEKPAPVAKPTAKETPAASTREGPEKKLRKSTAKELKKTTTGSTPPKNDLQGLARWLGQQGLVTSFDKGRANKKSAHASGRAIDINAPGGIVEARDPRWNKKFDDLATQLTQAGYNVLWKVKGHYNHIHVQTGTKGVKAGSFWKGGGDLSSTGGWSDEYSEGGARLRETEDGSLRSLINLLTLSGGDRTATYAGSMDEITKRNNNNIADLAIKKYADMVDKTVEEDETEVLPLQLPNLNARKGGTIQTPSSSQDRNVVNDYLVYFGYSPISPLQTRSS